MAKGKKAVLVLSFGTRYAEALKSIENIENHIQAACEGYDFFRVFTSNFLIRKIRQERGEEILSVEKVLSMLTEQGYEEVILQPTHMIRGEEYDKLMALILSKKESFQSMKIGTPLLTSEQDYQDICKTILESLPHALAEDEACVLMGHGSPTGSRSGSNASYIHLEEVFRKIGADRVYVGTVEDVEGMNIECIRDRLVNDHIQKAVILPFLVVAGDHARNDMAGDQEDSWKNILEQAGIETEPIVRGMGEIDGIAEIYVRHMREAADCQ